MIGIRRTVGVLLAMLGFGAGLWLAAAGFADVQRSRELERLPVSARPGAVLPGDAALRGIARPAGLVAGSPRTGSPSLYYRFLHEVGTLDEQGAVRWETRVDRAEAVDFVLVDASGRIRVAAQRDFLRIAFEAPERYHATEGLNRYTEWRIEPGDEVVLFGRARMTPSGMELGFRDTRGLAPVVSAFAAGPHERGAAGIALLRLAGGLALLALGVFGVALAFGPLRVPRYVALLSVVLAVAVAQFGVQMLRQDLAQGLEALQLREAAARARFGRELGRVGVPFTSIRALERLDGPALTGLPRETRENLQAIREDLERARLRLAGQFEALPVRWFASLAGLAAPAGGSWLPASEQAALVEAEAARAPVRIADTLTLALALGGVLAAGALTWAGLRSTRVKRRAEVLPKVDAAGVTCGLVMLDGVVETLGTEVLPASPLAGKSCVWFDYRVEERTAAGRGGRWRTVERRTEGIPFLCRDDAGVIRVETEAADVRTRHRSTRREDGRRVTEHRLEVGDSCHVSGPAGVHGIEMDQLCLRATEDEVLYLSNLPAGEEALRAGLAGLGLLTGAATLFTLALLAAFAGGGTLSPADFLLAALAAPAWWVLVAGVLRRDELGRLRELASRDWAGVQVSLRRRRNLLRPLNALVSRFAEEDAALQDRLAALGTTLRRATENPAAASRYLAAERDLASGLTALLERHPKLRASKGVVQLTRALTRLENEIALLGAGYEAAAARYDARLRSFPGGLLARVLRFEPLERLD